MKKLKSELVINILFSIIKALCMLWVIGKSADVLSYQLLGIFLLSRRFSSTFSNLIQLGMAQTIRRYVSANLDKPTRKDYVFNSLILWAAISIFAIPIALFLDGTFSKLIFGDASYEFLATLTCLTCLALVLHYVANSTLFAERRVFLSNIFDLMNSSGFIIIAMYIKDIKESPESILLFQVIGIIAICLIYLIIYLKSDFSLVEFFHNQKYKSLMKDFRVYGVSRGFVTFLDSLVLLIGPWIIRHEIEGSANLVIAYTFLRLIQTAINPISQIISMGVARNLNSGQLDYHLSKGIRCIIGLVLYLTIFSLTFLLPWGEQLLYLWLGETSIVEGVLVYYPFVLIALGPLSIFHSLKGIIEMKWIYPFNLVTLVITIIVQTITYYTMINFINSSLAISVSIIVSFSITCLITLVWLRVYLPNIKYYGIFRLSLAFYLLYNINQYLVEINLPILIAGVLSVLLVIVSIIVIRSAFLQEIVEVLNINKLLKRLRYGKRKSVGQQQM